MIEHFDPMQDPKHLAWFSQMSAVDKLLEIFCSDHPLMVSRWREIDRKAELHGLHARIAELETAAKAQGVGS